MFYIVDKERFDELREYDVNTVDEPIRSVMVKLREIPEFKTLNFTIEVDRHVLVLAIYGKAGFEKLELLHSLLIHGLQQKPGSMYEGVRLTFACQDIYIRPPINKMWTCPTTMLDFFPEYLDRETRKAYIQELDKVVNTIAENTVTLPIN